MFDRQADGADRSQPIDLVLGQERVCQVFERDTPLDRPDRFSGRRLADALLQKLERLGLVCGARTFAMLLPTIAVSDPVNGAALENSAHPSHRFNPRLLRGGCFRRTGAPGSFVAWRAAGWRGSKLDLDARTRQHVDESLDTK